ncbi:MAG: MEKHLA domain-containing protein [Paracoccaceae bacterium]
MSLPYRRPEVQAHCRILAESFQRLTGEPLAPGLAADDPDLARTLYEMPQPLVAHGTEADPIFCYANRAALTLWAMTWEEFTCLPSRLSAEPAADIQSDRDRYLAEAREKGWVADYNGIRIAATGQRFRISRTRLWTVTDRDGGARGQAALIGAWQPLG